MKELEQVPGLLQSGGTSTQGLSACICTKTCFSVPTCVLTRENGDACRVRCNTASCGGIALWVSVQSEDFTPSGFLMCLGIKASPTNFSTKEQCNISPFVFYLLWFMKECSG